MDLIRKIKDIRKRKGMSQAELAAAAGLSTPFISDLENGKKSPSLNSLEKISSALGIPFPILSFLAIDEHQISAEKQKAFKLIKPSMDAMIEEFFSDQE